jgi:hypothetical protein
MGGFGTFLLMVFGFGWALLAVGNIVGAAKDPNWLGLAILLNVGLGVIPGLIAGVYGWTLFAKYTKAAPVEFPGSD